MIAPRRLTLLTRRQAIVPLAAAALLQPTRVNATGRLLVAAASDLQLVLPMITATFKAETGVDVAVSFGSTGNIARQIRQGAPFEVFLAADERFIRDLARDRVIPDEGAAYARGRLALIARTGSAFAATLNFEAIAKLALTSDPFRLAIANPEHAPYGQRALEVIDKSPAAAALKSRVVYGETVTQAHQLVVAGAAQVGISAMSLARASPTVILAAIDERMHTPLVQRLAVTSKGGDTARSFVAYMTSRPARELLATNGFALP